MRYTKDIETVELETEILYHRMRANMGLCPLLLQSSASLPIINPCFKPKGDNDANQNTHA